MIDLIIKLEGKQLDKKYASVVIYNDVNKIPTATITILDGEASVGDFKESSEGKFNPGKEIEILMDKTSLFKGIIIKHRVTFDGLSSGELVLECKDKAVALTIVRKSRYSKPNEKEMDFLKKTVLKGYAGTINNFKETQKDLMQYDCTDWDFALSRAEMQGMLVRVSDGKVNIEKPTLGKKSVHTLTYGTNLRTFKGEIDARYQFDDVESTGWDYQKQAKTTTKGIPASLKNTGDLNQKDLSKILKLGAIELQSTGQLEEPELKAWASAQLFKSRMAMIRGTASFEGKNIKPLDAVDLKELGKRFNGKVLVTGVQHQIVHGTWVTIVQFGLSPKWFSQSDDFHGPPAAGMLPAIRGLQIGQVLEQADKDPDKQDRVKVSLPTIDAKRGVWARQALFSTGAIFRPKVKDEVIVGFLNDDPRQAIILGVLNNKNALAPVKSTEDKKNEKIAIYAPHNKSKDVYIQFDEKEHSIEIKTKKRSILLDEKKKEIQIKNDATTISMTKDEIKLKAKNIVLDGGTKINLKTKDAKINASNKLDLVGKLSTLKGQAGEVGLKFLGATIKGKLVNIEAKSILSLKGKLMVNLKANIANIKGKINKIG